MSRDSGRGYDPSCPGPQGREEILEFLRDDAVAVQEGRPSTCARCEREIASTFHLYRCAECGLPHHLPCLRAHFRDYQ